MMDITIKFVDFWGGFTPNDNFIVDILKQKYSVTVLDDQSKEEPDILFCSAFGHSHLQYEKAIKVYFTAENDIPNFNLYDYAISFSDIKFGDRHLRYPMYVTYSAYDAVLNQSFKVSSAEEMLNRDFCSVVISNGFSNDPMRELVWKKLDEYKSIASGGRYRNNVGGPVPDKLEFVGKYKFNLALENSKVDYYTTEKIVEPMSVGSVPIYWGNRFVAKEFNKDSFIDISDFDSVDNAIDYIRRVDNDDELYMKMLCAPKLAADAPVDWNDRLLSFLSKIIDERCKYVCRSGHSLRLYVEQKVLAKVVESRLAMGIYRRLIK